MKFDKIQTTVNIYPMYVCVDGAGGTGWDEKRTCIGFITIPRSRTLLFIFIRIRKMLATIKISHHN